MIIRKDWINLAEDKWWALVNNVNECQEFVY